MRLAMTHTMVTLRVTSTPPRPISHTQSQHSTNTRTPPPPPHGNVPPSYRLLYRGALSLPDSLLALDGLTFAARLDSPTKQNTSHLLENPLALALESMRGRPSLRLMGTIFLKDVHMDESGGVEMDIHPAATLSLIYFENLFCLQPFSSRDERSDSAIKVALGDSSGPETTEIVIFAKMSGFAENRKTIRLCVGRITPRPLPSQTKARGPRPDDPIPRKPPAFLIRDRELKRVGSTSSLGAGPLKKQKLAADLGSGVRLGADAVFKVPELPKQTKATGKGKGKEKEKEKDVFGDVSSVKGKQKADENPKEAAFEKANKNAVKRATIEYLGRTKDPTGWIDKSHPEFKELYGFVYRGVCFALRAKMRSCSIDPCLINRLVDMHALMYLGGQGGSAEGIGP